MADINTMQPPALCTQFAQILGSTIMSSDGGMCVTMRTRNLPVTIAGRASKSPLTLAAMFSYESMDGTGNALNLGETVILPGEINLFVAALQQNGVMVSAIHNHWLFDEQRIMYIHFLAIGNPLDFAAAVAEAFKVLK